MHILFCLVVFRVLKLFLCLFTFVSVTSVGLCDGAVPYFGALFGQYKAKYKTANNIDYSSLFPDAMSSYGIFAGLDLNTHFSFEIGIDQASGKQVLAGAPSGVNSVASKIHTSRYDIIGRFPLDFDTTVVGILGIVYGANNVVLSSSQDTINSQIQHGGAGFGYEYGFGIWQDFSQHAFGRFEYRRQTVSYGGIADGNNVIYLGIGFRL